MKLKEELTNKKKAQEDLAVEKEKALFGACDSVWIPGVCNCGH